MSKPNPAHDKKTRLKELSAGASTRDRRERLEALADGRRQRAVTFRPSKGTGSYKRPQRHQRGAER